MSRDTQPQMPLPEGLARRPAPRFNVISAVAPLVGVLCGCGMFYVRYAQFHEWAGTALENGIRTLGWFVCLGFLFAILAAVRKENGWGITALGLVANGALLIAFYLKNVSIWPGLWPEP